MNEPTYLMLWAGIMFLMLRFGFGSRVFGSRVTGGKASRRRPSVL